MMSFSVCCFFFPSLDSEIVTYAMASVTTHSRSPLYITLVVFVTIREETYFCLVDLSSVFWSRDSSSVAGAYHGALFPNAPTKLHILEEIERSDISALNIEQIHL